MTLAQTHPTPDRPVARTVMPRWCVVAAVVLFVLKLVLVSHNEIEIRSADDSGYAVSASVMYWGAPFQPYSYSRQPAYPLFIVLSQVLGVPMRVLIECVWFGACAAFATALRRTGMTAITALVVYALTLLSPLSLWMFNRLLPDGFYGACMLAMLAGLIGALGARTPGAAWRWGALAACGAAIAANTRQESPLVYGLLFVAGALAVVVRARSRGGDHAPALVWTRLAAVLVLPVIATFGLTSAFALVNKERVGMYVTYDLVAPGLKSLYRELLSIPPANPRLDVPVPRDVRDIAYAHSPSFAKLKPFLDGDGDPDNPYKAACRQFAGVDGEFGAWTVWGLRRAAWRMAEYKWASGADMDGFFAQAARELKEASGRGEIAHRRVLHEYLPPEYGQLAEKLPGSIALCWRQLLTIASPGSAPDQVDPWYASRIDAAAVRRFPSALVTDRKPEPPPTLWHQEKVVGVLDAIQRRIAKIGEWLIVAGGIASGLLALLALPLYLRGRTSAAARGVLCAGVLLLAAVVSRLLLFGVLDACGIFSQPRYLFIASVLLIGSIPIAVEALVRVLSPGVSSSRVAIAPASTSAVLNDGEPT